VALGEKFNNFMTDERVVRLNQTLNQPFDTLNRQAQIAQPFLRMHAAVQQRDIGHQRAFMSALADPQIMSSLGKVHLRQEALENAKFRTTTLGGTAKEAFNSLRNWVGNKTGVSTDDAFSFINGLSADEVTKKTMRDIVRDNAIANLDPEAAAQFQGAVESKRALQDPTVSMMLNQVYGGAQSRVGAMRAMGMSTANVRRRQGNQTYISSAYEDAEQRLMRGGWSMGDQAAGHQALLHAGAGYGRALGPIGIVSAGIGGLNTATELLRTGGTLSGSVSGASSMYRAAQRSIGPGGLDVAAGRDLFSMVGNGALASGQFGGSRAAEQYAAIAAGLIGGGDAVPLDVGAQQRNLGMLRQGNAAFGNFTSGKMAPLYQATSLQGAVAAAGGYGSSAEALTKMSPELLTAISRGGDVPAWAQSLGVGKDQASKFLQFQRKAPLFEVVDSLVGGSAGKTLGRVRAAEANGGDFMSVIAEDVGGRGIGESKSAYQKRRFNAANKVATDLGAAMFASGTASSPDEGAGVFLGQLAQDPGFAPTLRGRGVGAAGPKGAEAAALDRESDLVKQHGVIAARLEGIIKALPAATSMERSADMAVKIIGGSGSSAGLPGAIGNTIAALQNLQATIQREMSRQPQKVR
jgi:hypothetical protein